MCIIQKILYCFLLPKFALKENCSNLKKLNIFTRFVYPKTEVMSEFLLWFEKRVNVKKKPTEIIVFCIVYDV